MRFIRLKKMVSHIPKLSRLSTNRTTRPTITAMTEPLAMMEATLQKPKVKQFQKIKINHPFDAFAIPNQTTHLPQLAPHETFSLPCEHLTLLTTFFPHAHVFPVKNGHGGHPNGSSWHACGVFGCPHVSGGREQGLVQAIWVPQGIGGSRIVRPQ